MFTLFSLFVCERVSLSFVSFGSGLRPRLQSTYWDHETFPFLSLSRLLSSTLLVVHEVHARA